MNVQKEDVEKHRQFWAKIAKKNGWHTEPFYVQLWVDVNGNILDSVSYQGIVKDTIIKQ